MRFRVQWWLCWRWSGFECRGALPMFLLAFSLIESCQLASALPSKTLPTMGRGSGTKKWKCTAPMIVEVEDEDSPRQIFKHSPSPDDENIILEENRPLDQVRPSSGSKEKSKVCPHKIFLHNSLINNSFSLQRRTLYTISITVWPVVLMGGLGTLATNISSAVMVIAKFSLSKKMGKSNLTCKLHICNTSLYSNSVVF